MVVSIRTMRILLIFFAIICLHAQAPVGNFIGEIQTPGGKLRLGLTISATSEGAFKGELISIDQGSSKIPADRTTVEGQLIKVSIAAIGANFEGILTDDGQTINGKFTQGIQMDLVMKRVEEFPRLSRPQEPKQPYPYRSEELVFQGATADVKLAGTLTIPQAEARYPAVVLVSGSGPQNRDEELLDHKPFLVWADALTRAGFAVLRYDDRGVAKSTGKFAGATSQDFALDAAAAVAYLRTRKEIDPKRIAVMGHSEGGLIAPIVASKDPNLAAIVLLAGPGVTGERILKKQIPDLARAAGLSDEQVQAASEAGLRRIEKQMETDAWMKYFWSYDPAPALKKVSCPVLVINGELDQQVNADLNLPAIEAALQAGGNKQFTIRKMPKLNHLLQTAKTGAGQEYGKLEETVAPAVLEEVSLWLKKTLAMKSVQ